AVAGRRGHPADQVLVLGHAWRAAYAVRHPADRPRAAVELSPTDIALLDKWDAYTEAKVTMFRRTDTPEAPWTVVRSNDKKRARIEAMRSVLAGIEYDRKDYEAVGRPDPLIIGAPADMRELGPGQLSPTPLAKARMGQPP